MILWNDSINDVVATTSTTAHILSQFRENGKFAFLKWRQLGCRKDDIFAFAWLYNAQKCYLIHKSKARIV